MAELCYIKEGDLVRAVLNYTIDNLGSNIIKGKIKFRAVPQIFWRNIQINPDNKKCYIIGFKEIIHIRKATKNEEVFSKL